MKQWAVRLGMVGLGALALQTTALNVRATDRAYGLGNVVRDAADRDALNAHLRTRIRALACTERLEVARADLGLSETELCPSGPLFTPAVVAYAERR